MSHGATLLRSSVAVSRARSVVGVLVGPLAGLSDGTVLVVLPVLSHGLVERIFAVRGRHKGLDREKHGLDLEGGGPLVLEDVEANTACVIQ